MGVFPCPVDGASGQPVLSNSLRHRSEDRRRSARVVRSLLVSVLARILVVILKQNTFNVSLVSDFHRRYMSAARLEDEPNQHPELTDKKLE